ncbi:MAG TPA: hypothetical protein VJ642_07680 [Chromobacteriaceae bacterium]|nr:hypothetical protein [Chromobacteriaceae bacterium]
MTALTAPLTRPGLMAFGIYPLLTWSGLQLGSHTFRHYLLPAIMLLGLLGWWLNYRRYRLIADTPTSRAASAALGEKVELYGTAACHPHAVNYSPLSGRRCVWYRCWRLPEDNNNQLDDILPLLSGNAPLLPSHGTSEESFLLRDGKQEVIVHPEGAEVQAPHREQWREGNERLIEEWIGEGDPLYVVGHLTSRGGEPYNNNDFHRDVGAKLAEWKQDPVSLKQRFDLDGNGQIDDKEWLAVRAAAAREVRQTQQQLAAMPVTLHMQQPQDGSPYLINTHSPQKGAQSYRWRAWLHALVALGSVLLWLSSRH